MKRIIERLFFLLVGAIIATVAYTVGNTDRSATAQIMKSEIFDKVYCNELIIMSEARVPRMILATHHAHPAIGLYGKDGVKMSIEVEDDTPQLNLYGKEGTRMTLTVKDDTPQLMIGASKGGTIAITTATTGADVDINKGVYLGVSEDRPATLILDGNIIR